MNKTIIKFISVALLCITALVSCKKEPVNAVILDNTLYVVVGKTATLTVTFMPADAHNKKVSWESSNPAIATVDNGKVTGIAVGKATITVISQDNARRAECTVYVIQPIEPEMIWVEGGTFTIGCTDGDCTSDGREEPAHQVTVSGFYIGKYEITQKEWKSVMGSNPSYFKGDNLPVEYLSYNKIQQFIQTINAATDKNYRLPTEAEWEYAARGGKQSKGYKYSGSDSIDLVAWYDENSDDKTHPVGTKEPNELGIYDMSGNVWEFCSDWYGAYVNTSQINPIGPETGNQRVVRGGSYWDIHSSRVSSRTSWLPENIIGNGGFRLVLPAE